MVRRWYQSKLSKRPLLTQAVTTAVLFGAGDTLAQQAVERKGFRNHDAARTGRMVLYGGCEDMMRGAATIRVDK
ncbi:uncharacterized protein A1O9_12556 [Exophiala aquamarina CBS 119918]|uniref:Uncharacterized protein n=1 Tax=Exophiala aquamarina CBS 119918 TaxID=1182545 RepID=A0A072NVI8_9EURO|nr:uncharacterized protein A1O9_12556 [Exophiala aquamarina CBS 119918]KEF51407.1 hypothetical protein A1O9_12556 [Exophiala aquamarina CBS 119918]